MTSVATDTSTEEVSDKILTAPNVISAIRLLMVPLYMYLLFTGHDVAALIIFSTAALTDFVDGQVARRTHQVSKLGKLLDPAVDTILMMTGVLGVVLVGRLPAWIAVIIFARELFLLIGGATLINRFNIQVPVVYPGKVATTLLFVGFAGMILNWPQLAGLGIANVDWLPGLNSQDCAVWVWFVYVGLILQIGVTVYYCIQAWRKLKLARERT